MRSRLVIEVESAAAGGFYRGAMLICEDTSGLGGRRYVVTRISTTAIELRPASWWRRAYWSVYWWIRGLA